MYNGCWCACTECCECFVEPAPPLAQITADPPQLVNRGAKAQPDSTFRLLRSPAQSRAEVIVLHLELIKPASFKRPCQFQLSLLCPLQEVQCVGSARCRELSTQGQLLKSVLGNRLQEAI